MAMTKLDAMRARHTVRSFLDKPLPPEIVHQLSETIARENLAHDLQMALVCNDTSAFGPVLRLVLARGVRNYVVLAGQEAPDLDERLGYASAEVMLQAQMLGLNSWWVGGTFNRKGSATAAGTTGKVVGVVAIGYGATQGKPHKSKTPAQVSHYEGEPPAWFNDGVEAALLAPTAINKQAFMIEGAGDEVSLTYKEGFFSGCDLGIVRYHFELGAGPENFHWRK